MQKQYLTIEGKEFVVHFSMLGVRNFEEIAQKHITKLKTTWDQFIFLYSTLKALNTEFNYTLDEFEKITSEDPTAFINFQTMDILNDPDPLTQDQDETAKKKTTTKQIFVLWMLSVFVAFMPVLAPIISIPVWIGASFWLLWRGIKAIGSPRKQ